MRPTWLWKLMRCLNVGFEAQLQKDIAVIDDAVLKIIAQSLSRRENKRQEAGGNTHTPKYIISLFLDDVDATGQPFEPKLPRDIIVNFLIAGRDTTAQAMNWFFYKVSQKPSVAEKIRTEIGLLIPDLATGKISSPTMEDVHKLTYLEAALKETLRLHPSVPIIPKVAAEDTLLSDGIFITKGTREGIPVYAMARMPSIWGEDAAEFKPERWIDPKTGKLVTVSASKFVTFNAGPRMCLGMNLAMLDMKIVVASVLSRYKVELVAGQTITYENSVTLPIKGEMLVQIRPAES